MRSWLSSLLFKYGIWLLNPSWEKTQQDDRPYYHVIVFPRRITDAEYEYIVDWVRSRRAGEFV